MNNGMMVSPVGSWERLKDLNESNPVEVADYATTHGLQEEAAFIWWVSFTLHRRKKLLMAAKTCYVWCWQKFRIEVPKMVERALEIYWETRMNHW